MTRGLQRLRADSVYIDPEAVAALSPYIRSHISRFGQYTLDPSRTPPPVDHDLPILGPIDSGDQLTTDAAADH